MGFINPRDLHKDARLITLEGMDGVGKSTQVQLLFDYLSNCGKIETGKVSVFREPGGTPLGEELRPIVKTKGKIQSGMAAMMMFSTLRAELMHAEVIPRMKNGETAILDRSLYSTVAYQSFGKGVKLEILLYLNEHTVGICATDIVYLSGYNEVNPDGDTKDDAYEIGGEFAQKVRAGYEYCQNELWVPDYTKKHQVDIFDETGRRKTEQELHLDILKVLGYV